MKAEVVRKMSNDELKVEAESLRQKLFEIRSQAVTEKLENPRQIQNLRRDIARVLTEQTARSRKVGVN